MGANYISFETKENPTRAFEERRVQDQYDYGHAGYTGTFAEVSSVIVENDRIFASRKDAENHCSEFAEKWEPALAVQFLDESGKKTWLIGAWASS